MKVFWSLVNGEARLKEVMFCCKTSLKAWCQIIFFDKPTRQLVIRDGDKRYNVHYCPFCGLETEYTDETRTK